MKNELIKIVDLLIKKVEIEKQNEQKGKELASKNKDLSDLQTKYDMEVRSKEELVKELKNIRPKVVDGDERIILDILKKDSITYQDRKQVKKELDEKGFSKTVLGNRNFSHLGYLPYIYLYRNLTAL